MIYIKNFVMLSPDGHHKEQRDWLTMLVNVVSIILNILTYFVR